MKTFAKFILIPAVMLAFLFPGRALSEEFSMQIQGKPLSDVFQDLAELSGNDIVFDKVWGDRPITVRFVNLPLEKAISKILTNLNHVVIFEENNIRIKIYGPVGPDKNMNPMPVGNPYPQKTPVDNETRPTASTFPVTDQKRTETDEHRMEEAAQETEPAEAEEPEQETETVETAEAEKSERQDDENTDIKEEAGEQEEAGDAEATPPENGKKSESSDESGTE